MSTINHANVVAAQQAAQDRAKVEAAERAAFDEICNRHLVSDTEASYKLFKSYAGSEQLTVDICEQLLRDKPTGFQPAKVTKAELISQIIFLLEGKMSAFDLRNLKIRMESTWSLRQLRTRKKELLFKQQAYATGDPKQAAKAFLRDVRRTSAPDPQFPGFPKLLLTICPKDGGPIRFVDTAEYLHDLAVASKRGDKHAFFEYRKYIALYGSAQVDYFVRKHLDKVQQ